MTRKQFATKGSKIVTGAGSPKQRDQSSTAAAPNIVNEEYEHFWNMKFLPERGYEMKKAHPSFIGTINNLKWNQFVRHREFYIKQLVREFYAGVQDNKGGKVLNHALVRGKKVYFDSETINNHYNLPYRGDEFTEKKDRFGKRDMERVKSRVAVPNAPWEKISRSEFKLRNKYLIPELSNWYIFINVSILPTSHSYALPKERLLLLDAILTESNVDIGKLIEKEILDCAIKDKGYIFFPCLITELCMKQNVQIDANEERESPPNPISAEMKKRKTEKMKEKETTDMVQELLMQKHQAVWKFQQEQHEWLQLRFREISEVETRVETPVFPTWVFQTPGEEEEEELGEEEESEPEERKSKAVKRKRGGRKTWKGKRTVGSEEEIQSEDMEDTEEEEVVKKQVKRMERDESEEETKVMKKRRMILI